MTIIQPDAKKTFNRFIFILFTIILAGGVFYIYEYNAFVDARYELRVVKKSILEKQTLNVDLKNELYNALESPNLEGMAFQNGLIIENNPDYLKSNQWVSDSSL